MVSNGYNVVLISFGQEGTTNSSPASQILSGNSQESAQPVTVAADGTIQEPAQQPTGPFGDNFFLILVFVMVAVIGFSMLSGRKQKKQKAAMMAAISKNDTVQTIGGIIGRVVELKPDSALLEVDRNSNSRITVSRAALQQVVESAGVDSGSESTDD
ncbi:MAG: preprotein translocase subunit YajC [Phycisphaerales bacterium]|nr:preprotein translocase subunit YajC [Phycisphaerales bacterium]